LADSSEVLSGRERADGTYASVEQSVGVGVVQGTEHELFIEVYAAAKPKRIEVDGSKSRLQLTSSSRPQL
jgi:hypothetical protein